MSRKALHIWIPTNREYKSVKNRGKPAPMDGLNEIISSNRTGAQVGARRERENVEWCAWFIKRAMLDQHYEPMTEQDRAPVFVYLTVIEPNARRDVSNIIGGVSKYTLDALTARNKRGVGAIWDDSAQWVKKFVPNIRIDPAKPGIEITVVPLEDF